MSQRVFEISSSSFDKIQLFVCKNVYIDEKEDRKKSSTKATKKDTEDRNIEEISREVFHPLMIYPIKYF